MEPQRRGRPVAWTAFFIDETGARRSQLFRRRPKVQCLFGAVLPDGSVLIARWGFVLRAAREHGLRFRRCTLVPGRI